MGRKFRKKLKSKEELPVPRETQSAAERLKPAASEKIFVEW
jgi:hypothetical protein